MRPTNNQEALDNVREWFSDPERELALVRLNDSGSVSCYYRHPDNPLNQRCAIGCQMPDELYEPRFDDYGKAELGTGFTEICAMSEEVDFYFELCDDDFLSELQTAHDTARRRSDLDNNLVSLADRWNLEYTGIPA